MYTKTSLLAILVAACTAVQANYGGGYAGMPVLLAGGGGCGGSGACGGGGALLASAPILLAGGGGGCGGGGCGLVASSGAGPLAVVSRHRINYVPTASAPGFARAQKIFVDSPMSPVQLVVRSFSAPVHLLHKHIPSQGTFRATASVDGPSIHRHTVTKPVVQELVELVVPRRIIRQQVQPVQEDIQVNVARNVAGGGAVLAGGGGGGLVGGLSAGGGGGAVLGGEALVALDGGGSDGGYSSGGLVAIGGEGLDAGGLSGGVVLGGGGGGGGGGKSSIGYNGVPADYK